MTSLAVFSAAVAALISQFQSAKADGKITFVEVVQLVMQGVQQIVQLTQQLNASGADKKAAALDAVSLFIDQVIVPLPMPYVPALLKPILFAVLKPALMVVASAAIESAVKLFNSVGWPSSADVSAS